MFCCVTILLFICASFVQGLDDDRQVKSVVVVYRHGDRTPISFYPNDPYKDPSNWPVGFGQLTNRGKMMQFNLGKFLRSRYNHLIGDKYDENDIYVRASDVDRTMMSAMSNLAGLYPPKGDQIWNPNLLWQPIPVHTVPADEDRVIRGHPKCSKMQELDEQVKTDPKILEVIKDNQRTLDYLSEHTGANVTSLLDIDFIYDDMLIETIYNKTLPSWTSEVFPEKMELMKDLSFAMGTWNLELKRLRGGPLIQAILDHFQGFISGNVPHKMLMFSGHDTTVSTLLNTLGMFDPPKAPPYASLIMVELSSVKGQHFVNFLFRNETTHQPYPLSLPDCDYYCPLERFEELTEKVRPLDWELECNPDKTVTLVTAVSSLIAVSMFIILLIAVIVSCFRRCTSKKNYQYFQIAPN